MNRLREIDGQRAERHFKLHRFLSANNISTALSSKVSKFLTTAERQYKTKQHRSDVDTIRLLSGPLTLLVFKEMFHPYICEHPFFGLYLVDLIGRVCHEAIS